MKIKWEGEEKVLLQSLPTGTVFKLFPGSVYIKTKDFNFTACNLDSGELQKFPGTLEVTKVNATLILRGNLG